MMPRTIFCLALALGIATWSSQASAFDGKRKGFVLGVSIGPSASSFYHKHQIQTGYYFTANGESTSVVTIEDSRYHPGVSTDFRIGFAPSAHWSIFYDNRVSWFGNTEGDATVTSGVTSLATRYYFAPTGRCWYVTAGLGVAGWQLLEKRSGSSAGGLGWFFGGGRQLRKHMELEAFLLHGANQGDFPGVDDRTNSFALTLGWAGY